MKLLKPIILLCLLLLIPPASSYENIPIIGYYYDNAEEVKVHIGDDVDTNLIPSSPEGISYTKIFTLYEEPQRREVRLVLTTVNILPGKAKEEGFYDDLVYINDFNLGNLNDQMGVTEQDYTPHQVEMIFSSDLIHKGENILTITSGANSDKTNYDDFVIESIYMEQYGLLKHWFFSHISPDGTLILLAIIFVVLAGFSFYINLRERLPAIYQFLLAGGLGAILGMILVIKIQSIYFGFIFLIPFVLGITIILIGFICLAAGKYFLRRNIPQSWFVFLLRPLVFLILTLVLFFISYSYLYFNPGGPQPTYGVPVHRPEKEKE